MNRTMERLAPWSRVAVGADVSSDGVVAVVGHQRHGRLTFETLPLDAVQAAVNAHTAVACAMAPGQAMTVWLQTPLTVPAKARQVLPTLLDMAMPFAIEDCAYAFTEPVRQAAPLPLTEGSGLAALAVAVRRDDVARRLGLLEPHGINPHILDHELLALWTQMLHDEPSAVTVAAQDRVRGLVWVRRDEVLLALGLGSTFWSAHRLVDRAGGALERTVRMQLDTVVGGRYAQHALAWMWGGTEPAACAALRQRVEGAFPGSALFDLPHGKTLLARALAQRALCPGLLRFNLRSGTQAHPAAHQHQQRRIRRQSFLNVALAALLLALGTAADIQRKQQTARAEQRFTQGVERVAGWPVDAKGDNALLIAQRELQARQEALLPLKRAFEPSLMVTLDRLLAAAAASDATIHSLVLRADQWALQGHAPSREAVDGMLPEAGCVEAAVHPLDGAPDGRFGFRLEHVKLREAQP
ncbi:MAG TPA: hypothetical protein DCS43_05415 [Verrucomicrobia bacterium]|nr:hypothetical protein [Verrucomicrobiota bacterium]